ncbi:MAG: tetratricopeptide repeat protein [Candidatus Zixiibacteriota bacterium]
MIDSTAAASQLLDTADSLFKKNDLEAALKAYLKTVEEAKREFNHSVEVEALAQVARTLLKLDRKDEGRQWLAQAGAIARDSDPYGFSRYLGVKGRFEWQSSDLPQARKTLEEMYTYCNANSLYGRSIDAANLMSIVAESPEEGIRWSRRGIEAAEAGDYDSWLGPLWNNLAGTYYDMKQYDSSLECYIKAREYHWRFSGEVAKLFADYHIGMVYRLLGKLDEAGKWLRPVLAWAERIENHSAIGQACEDLGEREIALGNTAAGISLLERAKDEYILAGFDKSWPEIIDNVDKRIGKLSG